MLLRAIALSMFVNVSSMSKCHDDHQQDIVEDRVNDPINPHPQSTARSTA
jgi:hypothetical protein